MNKYENGKIYRLVCNITNKNYYGSTIQLLSKRLYEHKRDYKRYLNNNKNYITSFEIIKGDNFEIILVELFNCSCKLELEKRERYYIENNECINKNIPTRSLKEWYDDNKDNMKEYYKLNKDKIIEYKEVNKEKIKEYSMKYRDLNKEKAKEKRKIYTEANKEKIKEYLKQYYETQKLKNK